jgi:hypothetical protein
MSRSFLGAMAQANSVTCKSTHGRFFDHGIHDLDHMRVDAALDDTRQIVRDPRVRAAQTA